ncbi:MAG: hypothetical protein JW850_12875 [Thermoflexales bacterium]|nr:hypothetical protein [Thermoflexales bacterium]
MNLKFSERQLWVVLACLALVILALLVAMFLTPPNPPAEPVGQAAATWTALPTATEGWHATVESQLAVTNTVAP